MVIKGPFLLLSILPFVFTVCNVKDLTHRAYADVPHWDDAVLLRETPSMLPIVPWTRIVTFAENMRKDLKRDIKRLNAVETVPFTKTFINDEFLSWTLDFADFCRAFDLVKSYQNVFHNPDTHFLRDCLKVGHIYSYYYDEELKRLQSLRVKECIEEGFREVKLLVDMILTAKAYSARNSIALMLQMIGEVAAEIEALYLLLNRFKECGGFAVPRLFG
ncbi:uncharacterized protein LOC125672143 [Ostrea edulis]|uniref:uncharacterized protein LOC125672143 n=1 Tax=Ostrea edulis TaxID=37623 RepID=UPI00209468FD|nr:uncharacterized protein LOC125672143 [Ostrea edulis]